MRLVKWNLCNASVSCVIGSSRLNDYSLWMDEGGLGCRKMKQLSSSEKSRSDSHLSCLKAHIPLRHQVVNRRTRKVYQEIAATATLVLSLSLLEVCRWISCQGGKESTSDSTIKSQNSRASLSFPPVQTKEMKKQSWVFAGVPRVFSTT